MAGFFQFPSEVNEKAARVVAAGVFVVAAIALFTSAYWLAAALAAGFALRVFTGPRLDPFALFATRVAAPRLGPAKPVPGPPKRFAQSIGLVMSSAAAAFGLAGMGTVADVLLVALLFASGLESGFAVCLGCEIFAVLMRLGVVPEEVCAECANIWARQS